VIHDLKVKALKELIEVHSGHSILCAIQFRFEYDMIVKAFGKVPIVAGRTTTEESIRHIHMWNNGQIPLMLCHPQSISHGMNLQSGGNIILWYGLPWSLEQYIQLNGRLHRQGQKNAVVVNNLVFNNTIDQVILEALASKNTSQQYLLKLLKLRVERSTLSGGSKYDN
jgi:SNF2 family DNA or RNA helicase